MTFPIDTGRYRTRDGHIAVVTDTGCFAYGYIASAKGMCIDEFWDLDTGRRVQAKPTDSPLDLVEVENPN